MKTFPCFRLCFQPRLEPNCAKLKTKHCFVFSFPLRLGIASSGGFRKQVVEVKTYGIFKTIVVMRDGLSGSYMIDAASRFLLCFNASPVCPDILCNESGFYKGGKSPVGTNSPNQLKKDVLTRAILKAEKSSEALQDTAKVLTQFIELKKTALTMPVVRPTKKPRTSVLETMDEVQRLVNHSSKIDEGGYDFSPNTKAKLLDSIKAEQKKKVQLALNFHQQIVPA